MSMRCHGVAALVFLVLAATAVRAETETIGHVKTLVGAVTVISAGGDSAAHPVGMAMAIHEKDRIETGPDGEVGITFRDNTRITLGPSSRLDLAHFVFQPAEKSYGFVLRLAFGTLQYLSGLTAKLAPDAMTIETPGSTIAVRGTRLLIRAEGQR